MRPAALFLTVTLLLAACGGGGGGALPAPDHGRVLFELPDKSVRLVAAAAHGKVADLSARLHGTGPAAMSLNGAWVAVSLEDGCVAVATGDFTHAEKVTSHGTCVARYAETMHLSGDGNLLTYNGSGSHQRDLFVVRRTGPDDWSQPRNLTAAGPFAVNKLPRLNADASTVVFDCGNGAESDEGTSICAVDVAGGPVRTILAAPLGTGDGAWTAFHSPAYRPDGGLVFECHHPHEELVCALPPGATTPTRVTVAGQSNDNSPCVFPDGRIASLLDTGIHQLRVARADGTDAVTVTSDQDVLDVGIYCGG